MNPADERHWGWINYLVVYAVSFLICWGSLAALIRNEAKYVSVLSWNLFGLAEMYRHYSGGTDKITSPASLIPATAVAVIFTVTTWLVRSPKLRMAGIVIAIALAIATLVWFPNPWENM